MAARFGEVELLLIGAGWTSKFLLPLLQSQNISHAATTTTGRDGTIKFKFDPESNDEGPYKTLPMAKTVVITMPLRGKGQSKKMHGMYRRTHAAMITNWIQLGSTGIYQGDGHHDRHSEHDSNNERAIAEDELLDLEGSVLNLAGLWGDNRTPSNWVSRVAKSKEQLKSKGALHLIHGEDVARAIVAMHKKFCPRERWILTDRHVYDWWDLVDSWGTSLEQQWQGEGEPPRYRKWVEECMEEQNVKSLPRDTSQLGRVLDSVDFWKEMGILPQRILQSSTHAPRYWRPVPLQLDVDLSDSVEKHQEDHLIGDSAESQELLEYFGTHPSSVMPSVETKP